MEIIKAKDQQLSSAAIDRIRQVLRGGGIIVYPTDTVYGLGAIISHEQAVGRIKQLKGRPGEKPISIMVKDVDMAKEYGRLKPGFKKYLPGPYTLLVQKTPKVPSWITISNLVGIRIPDHQFTRRLMEDLEEPITTTSANLSGHPSAHSVEQLHQQLGEKISQVDIVIDMGKLPHNPPSTLIDMS